MPIQLNANDLAFEIFLDYLEETPDQAVYQTIHMQRPRGSGQSCHISSRKLPNCVFKLQAVLRTIKDKQFNTLKTYLAQEYPSVLDIAVTLNVSDYYAVLMFIKIIYTTSIINIEAHHAQLLDAIYNLANGGLAGRVVCIKTLRQQAELNNLDDAQIQQALQTLQQLGCIQQQGDNIILQEQIIIEHVDFH